MAANFESGFFANNVPAWHGLGVVIEEAPNSEEAIKLAGLDWEVRQGKAFMQLGESFIPTENIFNYRTSDNAILGVVKDQYKVVQNKDAFAFTDAMIATGEVKYETAGSLSGGKQVWMLAKLPETSILGEAHVPYLLFNNSHDGFGSVRVTMTNTRVVCQNTLNLALEQAPRIWSCAHKGDMENKLHEAQATMRAANLYMKEFEAEAERLARKKVSAEDVRKIMDTLFPVGDESLGERRINNLIYLRAAFGHALARPDIANFRNTAYGLVNAASDFAIHTEPLRKTETYKENRLRSFINGNPILDTVYKLVA